MTDILREVLLPKFSKFGPVRKTANGFDVCCPVHGDTRPSLSIGVGITQPVVMDCKAGCATGEILASIGLAWSDLCAPGDRPAPGEWTPRGEAVAVYDYTDEDGNLLFQVCRTADKQFPQRVPDPGRKSGWRWSLGSARRVLYRLPKVIEAVKDGEHIWVAEGEKDVHALEKAGVTATCNPGGAGKWRAEYAEFLRDAIVHVVADKDKPGRAHARAVAASLNGIAAAVEILEAAGEHKDAAAHLAAGLRLDEFDVTFEGEEATEPELAPDLYEFLAEKDPAEDWVIPQLLERGDRLIWTGEEGLGKSMVSRQICIAAAAGVHPFTNIIFPPQRVLFIDCENPKRKSRRRFRELEEITSFKKRRVPAGGLRIIHRPEGVDLSREEERLWLLERVTAHKPDLLFIGPLYKLHALDINEEQAARTIVGVLDEARVKTDCALVVEAHAPHGAEGSRALRPFGSSLFLRWPEFGYGIKRGASCPHHGRQDRHAVRVGAWRGPREERDWPAQLTWGVPPNWPWVPFGGSAGGDWPLGTEAG